MGLAVSSIRPQWVLPRGTELIADATETGGAGGHLKEDRGWGGAGASAGLPVSGELSTGRIADLGAVQKLPETSLILTICG